MKRLLCVWLPNWPIQRLSGRLDSERFGGEAPEATAASPPVILWRDDPRRGRLVMACCHRSAALGVRIHMQIAQAGEIVRAADLDPQLVQHDPWADQQSLEQLASVFQEDISPLVAIETLDRHRWADQPRHQPESLLSDITAVTHLFGGEAGLVDAAEALLARWGLAGRLAIADSLAAAWASAHYSHTVVNSAGTVVNSAGTVVNSAGTVVNSAGQAMPTPLTSLPIQSLRISTDTANTLNRLGIATIGQLLTLPRRGLASRLGKSLVRRIEQLSGEVDEPLTVHRCQTDHNHVLDLEYPTTDRAILADRIERLIGQATTRLASQQRGALRLSCRLELSEHPPLVLQIGLFAPTLDVPHLTQLVTHQVENKRLPGEVVRLAIGVTLSGPLRSCQTSLFPEPSSSSSDANHLAGIEISRLVDSLSGRLGRQAVLGVALSDDPLPENAYRSWPLTGNEKPPRTGKSRSGRRASSPPASRWAIDPSPTDCLRRPLSLLDQPIPLRIDGPAGLGGNPLPARFRLGGVVHHIVRYWGPERIETGWWQGPSIRRDYYRIETDSGRWYWIFRSLPQRNHRWMLHGCFE